MSCGTSSIGASAVSKSRSSVNVEALVLCSRAVIGEVQRFIEQRIEVDFAPLAAHPARVLQHALDDVVGPHAVVGDLFQIAGQHPDGLGHLGTLALAQRFERRGGDLPQLGEQLL
jgi:hypothetical protein